MINKCVLQGRLCVDPELRRTQSGMAVTSFTLAVDRAGKEKQTDFIEIVAWDKKAEFAAQYFAKGHMCIVSGRIQVRDWKDKQGQNRRTYEVIAEELHFAESKRQDTQTAEVRDDGLREIQDDGDLPF